MLKDKPDLSRWSLKYNAFGQDIKYSWLARNLQVKASKKERIIYIFNFDVLLTNCENVCFSLLLIRKSIGDLLKVFLISKQRDHKYVLESL